jgi:hypothetical protein
MTHLLNRLCTLALAQQGAYTFFKTRLFVVTFQHRILPQFSYFRNFYVKIAGFCFVHSAWYTCFVLLEFCTNCNVLCGFICFAHCVLVCKCVESTRNVCTSFVFYL